MEIKVWLFWEIIFFWNVAKDVAKNVAKDVAKNVAKLNTLSIRVYFIADHHKVAANKIRNSRSALFRWCFWAPNESRRSFTYPLVIFSAQPLDCLTSFQIVLDVHSTFSTAQLFNLLNCSTISNYSGRSLNCSTFSLFNLLNRLTTQLSQLFNFLNCSTFSTDWPLNFLTVSTAHIVCFKLKSLAIFTNCQTQQIDIHFKNASIIHSLFICHFNCSKTKIVWLC